MWDKAKRNINNNNTFNINSIDCVKIKIKIVGCSQKHQMYLIIREYLDVEMCAIRTCYYDTVIMLNRVCS